MAKKSLLPRGFKADAERNSLRFRQVLGLKSHEKMCGFDLAEHLEMKVFTPEELFPKATDLTCLIGTFEKNNGWSALTMNNSSGKKIIIHNNLHAQARQQSDIMHELAHQICEHEYPAQRENIKLPFYMREYNAQQEEEANYLGSVLQIPREGLIWSLKRGMNIDEIASYYTASKSMVIFRINSTGVKKQLAYLFG